MTAVSRVMGPVPSYPVGGGYAEDPSAGRWPRGVTGTGGGLPHPIAASVRVAP